MYIVLMSCTLLISYPNYIMLHINADFLLLLYNLHYNLNFGVKVIDIAEALHLSEEHLCRLFKMHTGTTIKRFITNLKIEKIKDLLKNTDRSIESIAVSLNCNQMITP